MKTKTVWDLYAQDLRSFILSKVKDEVIADDLLQETFIKVHTKLTSLNDKNKIKPWVFTVARYTVMDYFRKNSPSQPIDEEYITEEHGPSDHTHEDCLMNIIKDLPEKYRNPLLLADIQGMKQTQISERLNLPLSTVKSQVQRARKLVAQGFVACCDFKMDDDGYLVGELQEKEHCKVCH